MRIKKLELIGFKSFKDRTVIHFDEGVTGIVGPNGCGKSNIVDALIWVMGEMSAKHLRGTTMSDVIFAGAEGYAPMGMAEVTLTLENDGGPFPAQYNKYSEISVTRRLHRSGDTEYFINKEPARLRDIHEIFMDTGAGAKGFSIIEQGSIGKIVMSKPEERRTLIEEAAGITKFKVRKRESQRKLDSTDQNLIRLLDIIGEQKRQLESLQRQAQRAERYRKIKEEMRSKDVWLHAKEWKQLRAEKQTSEAQLAEAQEADVRLTSQRSEKEAALETARLSTTELQAGIESLQYEKQTLDLLVRNKENEVRELEFAVEQARRSEEMTGNLAEQMRARKLALDESFGRLDQAKNDKVQEYETAKALFEATWETFSTGEERIQEAESSLIQKRKELLTVSQSESVVSAKLNMQMEQLAELQTKVTESKTLTADLAAKKEEFDKRFTKVTDSLEQEKQMQLDVMRDVESFQSNFQTVKSEFQQKNQDLQAIKDEFNQVNAQLYGLENLQANFEGFEEGVKKVMMWQRSRHVAEDQQFQPLADVVEVPAQYELAMEAALGQRLQMVLTPNNNDAVQAVDYLKAERSGRSSFLSSDLMTVESSPETRAVMATEEGYLAHLADIVQVPENYRRQVAQFVGEVVIVDGLRTALNLRSKYPTKTFVTVDGDVLDKDGVLTGGSQDVADSGILKRRREIKELSLKREELSGKMALLQLSVKKLEAQMETIQTDLQNAQRRQIEKEVLLAELKKDFERAEGEKASVQRELDKQNQLLSSQESQLLNLQSQIAELENVVQDLKSRKQTLEVDSQNLEVEVESIKTQHQTLQTQVRDLQSDLATKEQQKNSIQAQADMVLAQLNDVNSQLQLMLSESEKNNESLSTNQVRKEQVRVELDQSIRDVEEKNAILSERKNEFEERMALVRELEKTMYDTAQIHNQYKTTIGEATLRLEQNRMRSENLINQMQERYMIDINEVSAQYEDQEGDLEAAQKEVSELRQKLNSIGEVNLSAIQEYEEINQRYEFLKTQHDDLIAAKEQLRKVIDRINRICSKRFKETFDQVNERFTSVFPVLFGGGEAKLILVEDQEDQGSGEVGIDIFARPPGKKMQSVSLLSGGEKALTAVALIFSIFLVKPSPYCLLDEVDAPLDDANVYRFNDLVREMAKRTQIIIVTHNKHTMKINNKLYGVTMQEKGVSTMVAVSLDEAEKVAVADAT